MLADFSRVVDSVNGAIDDAIPPERRLELRIGVNLGDVIIDADDTFGDGVNVAARLEALTRPGTSASSEEEVAAASGGRGARRTGRDRISPVI